MKVVILPDSTALEVAVAGMCPASVLELHPRVTMVLDQAAASRLALRNYYRAAADTMSLLVGEAL